MDWAMTPARSMDGRQVAQRAFGLALVALLHLLLLAALLQAVIHPGRPISSAREIVLRFLPKPVVQPKAPPQPQAAAPRRGTAPPVAIPTIPLPAPPAAAPDLRALGQSLFGCTPQALATLSPEIRSQCLNGFARPDGDAVAAAPSEHAKDPDRWAAAIRERNAPPGRIPCAYVATTPTTAGAGAYKVPMIEMVCLHKLLSH